MFWTEYQMANVQDTEAQLVTRNALHALMGLEATPLHTGGFKYIHRDTGLIFEIAPATPDSAGSAAQCFDVRSALHCH